MRLAGILCAAVLAGVASPASGESRKLPDLLIVGSPHLANPNRDDTRGNVPDVTAPERQRELQTLVDALARYGPTRIAVEVQVKDQARLNERYLAYRAGKYALTASEVDQIAFRLAAKLDLPRVEAVDWNGMPPMAEADFNYPAWAAANGRDAELNAWMETAQASATARQAGMRCAPVSEWYREVNTPDYRAKDNQLYFGIAMLGDAGPNWLGGSWYMRNLRIFAQLRRVANPGDRVLVLYGAGHGFLLDQYARQSGAFTLSDPIAYLPSAPRPRC